MDKKPTFAVVGGIGSWLWAAAMQISGYTNPTLAMILLIVGACCFAFLIWSVFPSITWRLWPTWKFSSICPYKILVPLDEAAKKARKALSSTRFGQEAVLANDTNEQVLKWHAMCIAMTTNNNIYGYRRLSQHLEPIHFQGEFIAQGGKVLTDIMGREIVADRLMIERAVLKDFIRANKN